MALVTENPDRLGLGERIPNFSVISTTGSIITQDYLFQDGVKGLVVVFTCNHCPYAQMYEDRMITLALNTTAQGIRWLAINSNAGNPEYPDDSMAKMKEKKWPFPYAADDAQEAARAFGAACTPEFFLFDSAGLLRFTGRLDDEKEPSQVTKHYLADALADLLAGTKVRLPEAHPIGCSIKWLGVKRL